MIRRSDALPGTQLNSVWLEGVLVTDPVDLASSRRRFRVQIPRPRPTLLDPPSTFLVEAPETALEGFSEGLTRGRAVRIIGRLHQHRWKDPVGVLREEIKIVGELVEATAQ